MTRPYILPLCLLLTLSIHAQTPTIPIDSAKMQWFKDAKLGIFIHWGIYAVNGIDESWSFYNGYISYDNYMKQLDGFTAAQYNPTDWANLIQESGAKYTVLTTKHHDGVALWDTKQNDLSVPKKTPAKRDVLSPFVKAIRDKNLKLGLYYSLLDWSHPDYPEFLKDKKKYQGDTVRWQRFLKFYQGQLRELSEQYNPDLYWFDGDWEHTAAEWQAEKVRQMLLAKNPKTILNSRLAGYGDYATPEQGVPIATPKSPYWELCLTMNDNWGYQSSDTRYKTPFEIIRIFADVISQGGNLLLDIGPKPDGTIPQEQVHILKELGKWTKRHDEAIFNSHAGLPTGHFWGPTTLSKDKKKLYLFLTGRPSQNQLVLKGIKNKINFIRVLGTGQKLPFLMKGKPWWSAVPGVVTIDVSPDIVLDGYMPVLCVDLEGELDLFREN
jgi:alpha-L-fucosidase